MTVAVTVLAFIASLGIHLLLKPRRSSREAQVQSALLLLGAALAWVLAVEDHSDRARLILQLATGGLFTGMAVQLLVTNRRPDNGAPSNP